MSCEDQDQDDKIPTPGASGDAKSSSLTASSHHSEASIEKPESKVRVPKKVLGLGVFLKSYGPKKGFKSPR